MNNIEVIKAFLNKENGKTQKRLIQNGYYCYEGRTLYTNKINNNEIDLINYSTVIAKIKGDMLYINHNKYSRTTNKIQSQLNYLAKDTNYNISVL